MVDYDYRPLVIRIEEELELIRSVIGIWPALDINRNEMCFVGSQYAIVFEENESKLTLWLLDNFYRQRR